MNVDMLLYASQDTHEPFPHRLQGQISIERFSESNRSGIGSINCRVTSYRECYAVLVDNDIAHESWLFYDALLPGRFGFDPDLPVIGECVTYEGYRGKGIYTHVLIYIINDLRARGKRQNAYVLVSPDNIASVRGIESAGYLRLAHLRGKRMLGFVFKKSIIYHS
jgi:RimJ/RimL family protein N-acetyltransferase